MKIQQNWRGETLPAEEATNPIADAKAQAIPQSCLIAVGFKITEETQVVFAETV